MPTPVDPVTYTLDGWAAGVVDDVGRRWSVVTQTFNDGAGRKLHTLDRAFGDGSWRAPSYTASRTDMVQGWCDVQGTGLQSLVAARDQLKGLLAGGRQGTLVIDDGIAPRQLTVEIADAQTKCAFWPDRSGFDWQLSFYANDPRFLSTTLRRAEAKLTSVADDGLDWASGTPGGLDWTGGGTGGLDWGLSGTGNNVLSLDNAGNAPAYPVFIVTTATGLSNPVFTDPTGGRVLGYNGTISPGQTLRMDSSPYTDTPVTLDGVDRTGALSSGNFIVIPPASSLAVQFTGVGDGSALATWNDAYN